MGQRLLGVAIVNYRGATDTAGLVRSIVGTVRGPDIDIALAIVDNSDEADELAPVMGYATANGIRAALLHGHGNVGYAAGNNLAARWLLGQGVDAIWVLNPDARISGGSLDTVADLLGTGCRAIGATAYPGPRGTVRPGLGTLDLWTGRSGPAPDDGTRSAGRLVYPAGHSLLITAQAWRDLDGFCEDFFLFFEEADLTVRSARLGIPTTVFTGLLVEHSGGGATGATRDLARKSRVAYFHGSRSCMIFFRRHYPRRLLVAVAARLLYAGKAMLRSGPGAAGAVVRGTVAGLRA